MPGSLIFFALMTNLPKFTISRLILTYLEFKISVNFVAKIHNFAKVNGESKFFS